MGRRSFDTKGNRFGLAPKQLRKTGEPFPDSLGDHIDSGRVRFQALVADAKDGIEACSSRSDHAFRTMVETTTSAFMGELDRSEILLIARRAMPARLKQAKRALQAGDASRKLTAGEWRVGSRLEWKEVDHAAQLGATGSTIDEDRPYAPCFASMSRRIQPRCGIVSMNSAPPEALRSFLRSLEMNTSMIFGCGWSSARR